MGIINSISTDSCDVKRVIRLSVRGRPLVRGFRHVLHDPLVMVWRVSSLQPKMVERKSRQGSILLYLMG